MVQSELKFFAVDWTPEELGNLVDNMIQNLATLRWLNLLLRALAVYYVDGAERIASGASKKSIELQMQSYSTRLIYSAIPFSSYAVFTRYIAAKLLNLLWLCEPQGRFATSPQNPKQFKNIRRRLSTVTIQNIRRRRAAVRLSAPPFHGN